MIYVLYSCTNTLHSMCAVPNMAVFWSSLISCFPGILLRYCLSDFEMVPVPPCYCWYHFCFHIPHAAVIRSLYFKILSSSFLIPFLSPEIATSVNMHVPFLLSWIMMFILLLGIVLLVHTCRFQNRVTWPSWLIFYYHHHQWGWWWWWWLAGLILCLWYTATINWFIVPNALHHWVLSRSVSLIRSSRLIKSPFCPWQFSIL